MSPLEIRARLLDLAQERIAAEDAGLAADRAYMDDLDLEVLEFRHALVVAFVTDVAVLHGELSGRNAG
jgi:hypothetical protein